MTKLVPKRRFKGFTEPWEQRELGNIVKITMGHSPRGENYTDDPKDFILVQGNADMKNGQVAPRMWTTQVTKTADIGDLIMSVRAPVGEVGKTSYSVVIGRGVASIKGNEFIYQALKKMNNDGYWKQFSAGSTFDSINSHDLASATVSVTDNTEQAEIGAFFKHLENLINLHQRKLEKTRALKSSYLSELFPNGDELVPKRRFAGFTQAWKQNRIGDIFTVTRGNVLAATNTSESKSKDVPFPVYSSQTKNNGLMGYYKDYLFDTAITWTTDGANAGTVNFREGKFYSTNVNGVLLSNEGYANKAVAESLNLVAWKYVSKVGNPKLMNTVMSDIIISLPPNLEEQKKISEFLGSIDELLAFHQHKLIKLQSLKKAYLSEMFI